MSLDDLQAQLRGAIDQQFAALKEHYERAMAEARLEAAAEARLEAAAEAQRAVDDRIAQAQAETEARLAQATATAREEAEQRARAAATLEWQETEQHLRRELEEQQQQLVEQARASARHDVESEREADRRRAETELVQERERTAAAVEAERQRAASELEVEKQRAVSELEAERQRRAESESLRQSAERELELHRERAALPPPPPIAASGANLSHLGEAIRALDNTRTLTEALDALTAHAGALAGRAALFVIDGDRLKAWKGVGIADAEIQAMSLPLDGDGLLSRAIHAGDALPVGADAPAPPFARAAGDRPGFAAPVMIGGRAVAVLYADPGGDGPQPGWPAASGIIAALVRHTSTVVALRTAMRTLDLLRGVTPEAAANGTGDDQSARRFARLLISEIKLYNEAAVRSGQQQHDLLQRLRPEIDRARRLYEERVPPKVLSRHAYFHQELVQTLADGDPALLGNP